jgi:NhaA family Na+:H+ antiporter
VNPLSAAVREFLRLEASSGILLLAAAVAAMAFANSPWSRAYEGLLAIPVELRAGSFEIAKPLLLWINDGLMAVFFFLVGLEIKREFLEGHLADRSQAVLPALAALGGMAVPGAIYAAINWGDPVALRGWAIPTATDIAFAVGVLALLGSRVPAGLKVFLLTLAILDDLGAIVVIALFYTDHLSLPSLAVAGVALAVLAVLNRRGLVAVPPYLFVGAIMWAAVLKSGVHATLAGVALALFIPMRGPGDVSPLRRLEHDLHAAVAYSILPLFAFANAGVPLAGMTLATLASAVPAGIALGLVAGKTAGVLGAAAITVRLGLARLPEGANWPAMLGVAILCGIGFTMSLFIGSLAFEGEAARLANESRLGILVGSVVAGALGFAVLRTTLPPAPAR